MTCAEPSLLALQCEDGATRCFASFQSTVRFLNLRQREGLINVNFHLAALHHGKQVVGHGLRAFARSDVTEQGLTCDVQGALWAQNAWREGCHCT